MRYVVFEYPCSIQKGFSTDFKILAFLSAFLKKLLGKKEFIYDSEVQEIIYASKPQSIPEIPAQQPIFYHCIECGEHFGCNLWEKGQFWCADCEESDVCCAQFIRHKGENISHGICRSCFNPLYTATKQSRRA